ncbi:hypothetical protein [Pseudomonas sp. LT1P18]|uniref:hypothetical protein n=1 Tax=Pseudomonas arabinosi TaxID=3398357 RepID=UPI0039F0D421
MTTIRKLLNSLALLSLVTAVSQAQAGCEDAPFGERTFTICKVWPAYDDQSIVATSTFKPDSGDANNDGGNVDLELSLIHSSSSKRLASYHKKDAYYSDAVAYEGLSIDTARYKLTTDSRAFGIRSSFEHSSSVNPYHKTELALYLKEGDTLRPVLEGLVISTSRGEWDGNCAGEGERTQRTVDIGNTTHNGFADLVVSSTVTETKNFLVGDECKDTSRKLKTTRVTLNYDGKQYVVPEALRG